MTMREGLMRGGVDINGTPYDTRTCPRCRVEIAAPASRISHVYWMHEKRCLRATPEERAVFQRTRHWPKVTKGSVR